MKLNFRSVLILMVLTVTPTSTPYAQELGLASGEVEKVVKVAGVVQFVEGRAVRTDSTSAQTDLVYQSILYEGDRIETAETSALKFATRSGCLVVLRGQAAALAPSEKKSWRLRADNTRIICSNHKASETFAVSNVLVTLREGEVLVLNDHSKENPLKILVVRGSAQIRNQTPEPKRLYVVDASAIKEASPQPSADELRALNLSAKPPRESADWPRPKDPPTVRLIFGPVFGTDRVVYDNQDLSQKKLSGDGPRLQVHLRTRSDRSIILALTYREAEDQNRKNNSGASTEGPSNKLGHLLLEVGERFRHDRWWSPFYRFGAGFDKAEINYSVCSPGCSQSGYKYEFYIVSAAFGLDAHFVPQFLAPFGFYASVEGQVIQSFTRGAKLNAGYSSGSLDYQEPWKMTDFNLSSNLGLQYQF